MPFRIKVSLIILAGLAAMVVVAPLLLPRPPLTDTRPARDLAYPDSLFLEIDGIELHVQTHPPGLTPAGSRALAPPGLGARGADAAPGAAAGAAGAEAGGAAGGGAFLLLHGFGSHTMTWRRIAPALGEQSLALAFDRPAFGLTERPLAGDWQPQANPYAPEAQLRQALGLLDAYGIAQAVVIGHSAGGSLALELALQHPERVAGVVVVGGAVVRSGGAPSWARPLLRTPQMERLGPLLMRQLGGPGGDGFLQAAYADPSRLDPVDVAAYRLGLSVEDWDLALWELTKVSREPALLPRLPHLDRPVLVVTGAADAIVPPAQSEEVARALPRATFVSLEGCGHVVQEECPGALLEAVVGWLEREVPVF